MVPGGAVAQAAGVASFPFLAELLARLGVEAEVRFIEPRAKT